ncbi:MAG: methionyl-tRNA synthetase [Neisseria sicca]|nr:methionyl-tRNA synthetase [Neisseria sicca]
MSSFDDFGLRSSEKQFQTTSLMFSGTDNHFQDSFSALRTFCTTCARSPVIQGLSVIQTVNVFLIQTTPQAN